MGRRFLVTSVVYKLRRRVNCRDEVAEVSFVILLENENLQLHKKGENFFFFSKKENVTNAFRMIFFVASSRVFF